MHSRRSPAWNVRGAVAVVVFVAGLLTASLAHAQAHGPTFALATPTLGQGDWSSNTMTMAINTDQGTSAVARQMFGYGVTPRLQVNFAAPITPNVGSIERPPRTRFGAMMNGGMLDVEGIVQWRFAKYDIGVGKRIEATASVTGTAPLDADRGGIEVGPSTGATLAAGYASRSYYAWLGGGYNRYFEHNDDRIGDLPFATATVAWRPAFFRNNPDHDWRIFMESVAEFPGSPEIDDENRGSRGTRVSVGPSLLGLYGSWGFTLAGMIPVYRSEELEEHRNEELRFIGKAVVTYWF